MRFFTQLPNTLKGALCIIAGIIVLFDAVGFKIQILHTLVLMGAISAILIGIYFTNLHMFFYKLWIKNDSHLPPE